MVHEPDHEPTNAPASESIGLSRRKAMGLAATAAAAGWTAPVILSSPAWAQATPGGGGGGSPLTGDVTLCQGPLGQNAVARVWATAPNAPPDPNDTVIEQATGIVGPTGSYSLAFASPGSYDVFAEVTFNGSFTPPPDFQGTIVVPAGGTTANLNISFCP